MENTLKSLYHVLEAREFHGDGVALRELAERRRETFEEAQRQSAQLVKHGLATLHEDGNIIFLTPAGLERAAAIVRNHRLWELYLTHAARIPAERLALIAALTTVVLWASAFVGIRAASVDLTAGPLALG